MPKTVLLIRNEVGTYDTHPNRGEEYREMLEIKGNEIIGIIPKNLIKDNGKKQSAGMSTKGKIPAIGFVYGTVPYSADMVAKDINENLTKEEKGKIPIKYNPKNSEDQHHAFIEEAIELLTS